MMVHKTALKALVLLALVLPLYGSSGPLGAAQSPSVLQVSPTSLDFKGEASGPQPSPQLLTIMNTGTGLLEWTASANVTWITLGANEGKLSSGRAVQLAVLVNTQGLAAGLYQGTITIKDPRAEGSPVFVGVTLTLMSPQTTALQLIGVSDYHARGITGRGVKVGIIDLGFAQLQAAIDAGELPSSVVAWNCLGSDQPPLGCKRVTAQELDAVSDFVVHGTAVAEIVHDVAPAAELHLFLINAEAELAQAVEQTIDEGLRVINHSVVWFSDGGFYDCSGSVGKVVRDARGNGVLWVNAAGNFAQHHYEGTFQDADGDGFHDTMITLDARRMEPGQSFFVYFTWDAWPQTDEDFDLFLLRGNKTVVSSSNSQNGTEPEEQLLLSLKNEADADLYQLKIQWVKDTAPPTDRRMELFVNASSNLKMDPAIASSSLPEPANCTEAFVVGSVQPRTLEIEPLAL